MEVRARGGLDGGSETTHHFQLQIELAERVPERVVRRGRVGHQLKGDAEAGMFGDAGTWVKIKGSTWLQRASMRPVLVPRRASSVGLQLPFRPRTSKIGRDEYFRGPYSLVD